MNATTTAEYRGSRYKKHNVDFIKGATKPLGFYSSLQGGA